MVNVDDKCSGVDEKPCKVLNGGTGRRVPAGDVFLSRRQSTLGCLIVLSLVDQIWPKIIMPRSSDANDGQQERDHMLPTELSQYPCPRSLHSDQTSPIPPKDHVDASKGHLVEHQVDEHAGKGSPTAAPRRFSRRKQIVSLLWSQSLRWVGTMIFCVLLVATMKVFEDKGNFTHTDKLIYNVIVTGLSVGLGLNFFVSNLFSFLRKQHHPPQKRSTNEAV